MQCDLAACQSMLLFTACTTWRSLVIHTHPAICCALCLLHKS